MEQALSVEVVATWGELWPLWFVLLGGLVALAPLATHGHCEHLPGPGPQAQDEREKSDKLA